MKTLTRQTFLLALTAQLLLLLAHNNSLFAQVTEFVQVPHDQATRLPRLEAHLLLDPASTSASQNAQIKPANSTTTPVVFWHGMGDTAYGSINVERLALQRKYPGMKVFSVQIGSNSMEDELAGYFSNVNDQVAQVCQLILQNEDIKRHGSFNAIGFSQGGQFIRALIQRCPFRENNIKVRNFISLGGQHQGVFGLPRCPSVLFCEYIRELLNLGAYEKQVQEHLVQAEYWHNPLDEDNYRRRNIFLSDINNELSVNETYKSALLALENMVLVKFEQDEMVVPRESSHFGFYSGGQTNEIEPLRDGRIYREDRLGLRQLDQSGRLKSISVPGRHLHYKMDWFMDKIASVYLSN